MTAAVASLETFVKNAVAALADDPGDAAHVDTTMRERFFELMVLILGNLYTKTPVASSLFDRGTMLKVTAGMDDVDAGKLTARTEDWLRLEGLLRQQDGAKAYFLTRSSLSVLSTFTSEGPLGDVMANVLKCYQNAMPSENLRSATRLLGSYYVNNVTRD
jgi:hypothetical protein